MLYIKKARLITDSLHTHLAYQVLNTGSVTDFWHRTCIDNICGGVGGSLQHSFLRFRPGHRTKAAVLLRKIRFCHSIAESFSCVCLGEGRGRSSHGEPYSEGPASAGQGLLPQLDSRSLENSLFLLPCPPSRPPPASSASSSN